MDLKEENINYSIEPWQSQEEFIAFYETLFENKKPKSKDNINNIENIGNSNISNINILDKFIQSLSLCNLKKSMIFLIKWDTRGENKMFCLPILLLVNTLIKIKEDKINNKDANSSHILAEVLIRVINIIMDQLRKSKKAVSLNMYLIAKDLELPEFIIDIRHSSTHKNLPSFNELLFAVQYMLYWIKIKLIEPKYNYFIKEKNYFIFLLKQLNNNDNTDLYEQSKLINKHATVSLEPDHLLTIITHIYINIKKNFDYNIINNKISYDKNNYATKNTLLIFKKVLEKEKEIFVLMIFSFVYQQILKINNNKEIKKDEKEKYKQYLLSFIKIINNNIPKDIEFDLKKCEILYLSNFFNIKKLINESKTKEYNLIMDLFIKIFKEFNKNINHENEDILKENLGNFRKNVEYVDLYRINGNINAISYDNLDEKEEDFERNDIEEKKEYNMDVEEDINNIINKDIIDNYNNYNSLII